MYAHACFYPLCVRLEKNEVKDIFLFLDFFQIRKPSWQNQKKLKRCVPIEISNKYLRNWDSGKQSIAASFIN